MSHLAKLTLPQTSRREPMTLLARKRIKLLGLTLRSCVQYVSFLINGNEWAVALIILAICTLTIIAFW